MASFAVWQLSSILILLPLGYACLATTNPNVPETTAAPVTCPCSIATDTTALCPAYPKSTVQVKVTVVLRTAAQPATDPPCTLVITGCTQYRFFYDNHCEENGNPFDPTAIRTTLTCTTGPDFLNAAGEAFKAVDCQR